MDIWTRRSLTRAAAGVVVALAIASCSGTDRAAGGDVGDSRPQPYPIKPVDQRSKAPALTGKTVSGLPLRSSDLHGKAVVVNFWASWCGPCRAESTVLEDVFKATASRGVAFVGVNEKDTRSAANTFSLGRKVSYPSLFDPDGDVAAAWPGAQGLPYTFIVDKHGRVAVRLVGGVTNEELTQAVLQVVAEK